MYIDGYKMYQLQMVRIKFEFATTNVYVKHYQVCKYEMRIFF